MTKKTGGMGKLIYRRSLLVASKNRLVHEIESKGMPNRKYKHVSKKIIKSRRYIESITKEIYCKISKAKKSNKYMEDYESTI